ncbi:MAG: hypothetical protein IT168_12120 [Bryobacterales bacterium]|nr:hypothetical protein [Bryobacterales bacterium]
MKTKRVAIYGGTDLDASTSEFVEQLTIKLLKETDAILVTGGFDYSDNAPKDRSTDRAVADAAEKHLGAKLNERLETWLPEAAKDRIDERVHRFTEKGRLVWMEGSARKRRLRVVNDVDALITVKGKIRTSLVLDVALTIGKPALPLPFTGGDSLEFWKENKPYYKMRFGLTDGQIAKWESFTIPGGKRRCSAVLREVVEAVKRVLRTSCLVLMPFRPELKAGYEKLKAAITDEGFEAIRLDEVLYTGDVRTTVKRLLTEADAIIVDVTEASPNVFYELGYAHAYDREPLLVWRVPDDEPDPDPPFYLENQRLVFVRNDEALRSGVTEYFARVRSGKGEGETIAGEKGPINRGVR